MRIEPIKRDVRWLGQPVVKLIGVLDDLPAYLPSFSRVAFTYGNALNEFLDIILREPIADDLRRVPVATVSKKYVLLQHVDAVNAIADAFKEREWDTTKIPVAAWLSEYGERLRVHIPLPNDPVIISEGDELNVEMIMWNSVDRSTSFDIALRWVRVICRNGLAISGEDRNRKIHNVDWIARGSPIAFLSERLPVSTARIAKLQEWLSVTIADESFVKWVNTAVTELWGKLRAARVCHIARTGHDCALGKAEANIPASRLTVVSLQKVPGQHAGALDAYHLYQTLLWIAGDEETIERQEAMANEALRLIKPLLPEPLRPA